MRDKPAPQRVIAQLPEAPPGAVRRLVTHRDPMGKSVVYSTAAVPLKAWPAADAGEALLWSTAQVPADNSAADLLGDTRNVGFGLPGGSAFRVTELGPHFTTPLHRTLSLDYCLVLAGEVEIRLDSGQTVRLLPGDAVVQRGTRHAWHNPSPSQRCRFVVAMLESEPISSQGRTLGATPSWRLVAASLWALLTPKQGGTSAAPPPVVPGTVRCLVTQTDAAGKSVVHATPAVAFAPGLAAGVREALLWRTARVPADNAAASLPAATPATEQPPVGTSFWIKEVAPACTTALHRTQSIDYCLVLTGELDLLLDGGQTVRLLPGDAVVQRGTTHAWHNPSGSLPCRLLVSMIASKPD